MSGAAIGMDGQILVFDMRRNANKEGPWEGCYRCMYPTPARENAYDSCAESGVLGPVPGVIGTLMAVEVLKLSGQFASPATRRLQVYDATDGSFHGMKLPQGNPGCALCGAGEKGGTLRSVEDSEVRACLCCWWLMNVGQPNKNTHLNLPHWWDCVRILQAWIKANGIAVPEDTVCPVDTAQENNTRSSGKSFVGNIVCILTVTPLIPSLEFGVCAIRWSCPCICGVLTGVVLPVEVTATDLSAQLQSGASHTLVVDVREPSAFSIGSIQGRRHFFFCTFVETACTMHRKQWVFCLTHHEVTIAALKNFRIYQHSNFRIDV